MKVTLKNLEQATAQQVFDQVAKHMRTQMKKSYLQDGGCLYKGPNGLSCAAGCLIADDEYSPEWEGLHWSEVAHRYTGKAAHMELISQLQEAHDFYPVIDWAKKLKQVADKFNLNTDNLCDTY